MSVLRSVIALDPGGTTGICRGTLYDDRMELTVSQERLSCSALYELLNSHIECALGHDCTIIYEDFQYRNVARMGLDLTPVKLIGVIELFQDWHDPFVEFAKQTPAAAKAYYTDARLKNDCLYQKGNQHGRDAERHLLYWANFGKGSQWVNLDNIQVLLAP